MCVRTEETDIPERQRYVAYCWLKGCSLNFDFCYICLCICTMYVSLQYVYDLNQLQCQIHSLRTMKRFALLILRN